MSTEDEWYWDLRHKVAVPAAQRGPGDQVLGPYPSRHDAENWKSKLDERNEGWIEADEAWEAAGDAENGGATSDD